VSETIDILGVPIHYVTMDGSCTAVADMMSEPHVHQICTVNPEFVMRAQEDDDFRRVLYGADLCLADGIGLVMASRHLRPDAPLPERVPGSELVYHLAELCARNGWRLFLLGAAEGVAAEAGELLTAKYPELVIAGTYSGSPALAENDEIVARINRSAADMLYVAYGAPKQDKWIARNLEQLTSVRVALGVGGSLDFITGRSVRAPRWVQNLGLEWLHRLVLEPWRWRRMLALPRFVWAIIWRGSR